jgi:hypothetical protein
MAALAGEQPDRVPLLEFVIDPRIAHAICPEVNTQTEFEEAMDFDAVCCSADYRIAGENPDGTYFDEWGVLFKPGPELQDHPIKGPIASEADLRDYRCPSPDAPWRLGVLPELVRKFKFKKAIVFRHRAAFMWSAFLNGMDNLLMNFLTAPEFAHRLLDKVLEVNIKVARTGFAPEPMSSCWETITRGRRDRSSHRRCSANSSCHGSRKWWT